MRCDWAGCRQPAHKREGQWLHCVAHWDEHLLLAREEQAQNHADTREATRVAHERFCADLSSLHARGLSDVLIAQTLGRKLSWVRDCRHDLGLVPNAPVVVRSHGTHAGFNSHRARRETPCEACVIAERTYQRERARTRRKVSA